MSNIEFRPKQTLGQNFLVDENVARKIVNFFSATPDDVVIEIGAGFGVLTKYLVQNSKHVIAVEIDRYLIERLKRKFSIQKNFTLVEGDFLKTDITELLLQSEISPFGSPTFKIGKEVRVIGNIPYHITSQVVFKIFEHRDFFKDMQLMIQREVAQRIVAKPRTKDYGILSVFSQFYSVPKLAFHVSPNVFNPKPDVESSVVRWDFENAPEFELKDMDLFRAIVRGSFNHRRKMLRKSLQQVTHISGKLNEVDFDLTKRPEELTVEQFVELSNLLSE